MANTRRGIRTLFSGRRKTDKQAAAPVQVENFSAVATTPAAPADFRPAVRRAATPPPINPNSRAPSSDAESIMEDVKKAANRSKTPPPPTTNLSSCPAAPTPTPTPKNAANNSQQQPQRSTPSPTPSVSSSNGRKSPSGKTPAVVIPPCPLPLPPSTAPYTLVLDLDETLVHTYRIIMDTDPAFVGIAEATAARARTTGGTVREFLAPDATCPGRHILFMVRPWATELLDWLSTQKQHCEVVLWTAGKRAYADAVVNALDKRGAITHRVCREDAWPNQCWSSLRGPQVGQHTDATLPAKDLSYLGRDMSRTMIVDDCPMFLRHNPQHAVVVTPFRGQADDLALPTLVAILRRLFTERCLVPQFLEEACPDFIETAYLALLGRTLRWNCLRDLTPTEKQQARRSFAAMREQKRAEAAVAASLRGESSSNMSSTGTSMADEPPAGRMGCEIAVAA